MSAAQRLVAGRWCVAIGLILAASSPLFAASAGGSSQWQEAVALWKNLGYSTDVHSIWTAQSCTLCHNSAHALDLTGSASVVYPRVTARVNLGSPASSLILTKPQPGTVSHSGGEFACFSPGSSCYDTILEWIQGGATFSPCSFAINPTSRSHGAGGGSNSVAVTAGAGCAWTASEALSWVTITSGGAGSGNGTVSYSVSANASPSPRSGNLTIAGKTFTIDQEGAPACSYAINPSNRTHAASSGTGTVDVTAGVGCAWTATENLAFVNITAGAAGSGNGTVSYAIDANASASPRSGNLTIAGKTFTVNQDAAGCTYAIDPTSRAHAASGGTGTVNVTAGTGCAWTATESLAFVNITGGAAGSGNGTVSYAIDANATASPRSGNLTIAGKTFAVTQSGGGGACAQDADTACLAGGRFRVEMTWRAPNTATAPALLAGVGSENTTLFRFLDPDNWEALFKILNGCGLNNRYWVFFAATTNVEFGITVTDTQTGTVKVYTNQLNHTASPVQDTSAFATCP
jgi:hypothetical protein